MQSPHSIQSGIFKAPITKGESLVEKAFVQRDMRQVSTEQFNREVRGRLRPTVVFFHIPKCAGTSILGYINQHYPLGHVLADLDVDRTLNIFSIVSPERGWAFVGHIDFAHYRQITIPHISFSIFRDPRQRLASRYFSLKDQHADFGWPLLHLPREQSFEEWLTVLSDKDEARKYNGPHGQEDQYYYGEILRYMIGTPLFVELTLGKITEQQALTIALGNIKAFDFCLITEDLDRGKFILDTIMQVENQPSEMVDLNQSVSSTERKADGLYEFNASETALLNHLCRLEMPIYEAAKVIYDSYFDG